MPLIKQAISDQEIEACFDVLHELRPHLVKGEFVKTVLHLMDSQNFSLAYLMADKTVMSVAGYRVGDWLYTGRYMEVEDLVTSHNGRSKGYGGQLFNWLVGQAKENGCKQLKLVSGVSRHDAHRFYKGKGMKHEGNYFSLTLK